MDFLKDKPLFFQIVFLCLCVSVSLTFFYLISVVLITLIYKINIFDLVSLVKSGSPDIIKPLRLLQILNTIGVFIVPSLIFGFFANKKIFEFFLLNKKPVLISIILVFFLMLTIVPVIDGLTIINSKMNLPDFMSGIEQWLNEMEQDANELTKTFLLMKSPTDLIMNILMIVLLPAIGEEMLFRGILQPLMIKMTKNIHWGIIMTAILFSALHMQFYGFLPRLILGALLGYLFAWSGNLWLPIIAHLFNNGFAVVLSYIIGIEVVIPDTNAPLQHTGILFLFPSILISGGLIFLFWKIEVRKKKLNF